jgi:succinoglycan biosynthesis transport protein ExoP
LELTGYLAIVKRWWWTLIVAAWIAGLAGYIVASTIPPTYESTVKVLVGPLNTDTDTLRGSGLLVQTYAQYVTTLEVLGSAIQELGLDASVDDVSAATRATANDVTRILTIQVQADDPQQASDLANTLATELEQLASSGLSRPEGLIRIIEFARPGEVPVAPQVSLLVILAAAAGVIIAIVVVLLLEYFGNIIRTREELAALTQAPLLAAVVAPGGDPPKSADFIDMTTTTTSRRAEAYRLASAKIALGDAAATRTVLVTDVDWEGEAAVVGANLAAALARFGRNVVLIDGAGPDGTLTRLAGRQGRPGLAELLTDHGAVAGSDPPAASTAGILTAGAAGAEGADPGRLRQVIASLAGDDGIVVLVGAPISAAPLTLALAQVADTVILVAGRDRSRRDDVSFVAESLRLVGVTLSGVILTERASFRMRGDGRSAAGLRVSPIEVSTTSDPAGSAPVIQTKRMTRTDPVRGSRPRLADPDEADGLSAT